MCDTTSGRAHDAVRGRYGNKYSNLGSELVLITLEEKNKNIPNVTESLKLMNSFFVNKYISYKHLQEKRNFIDAFDDSPESFQLFSLKEMELRKFFCATPLWPSILHISVYL